MLGRWGLRLTLLGYFKAGFILPGLEHCSQAGKYVKSTTAENPSLAEPLNWFGFLLTPLFRPPKP